MKISSVSSFASLAVFAVAGPGLIPFFAVPAARAAEDVAHSSPPPAVAAPHPAETAAVSRATLAETVDWLKKKASFREEVGGITPGAGDDGAAEAPVVPPVAVPRQTCSIHHSLDYTPQDGMLTITDETYVGDNRLATIKTSLPLSKLDAKVGQNPDNPREVHIMCTGPLKLFQQIIDDNTTGQRTEGYSDRYDLTFDNVNTAERAVLAMRHLIKLTAGAGPVKPANEPF